MAEGEAHAARVAAQAASDSLLLEAEAEAAATKTIGAALDGPRGEQAAQWALANRYVAAFGGLGQRSSTMMLPANAADVPAMVAQAMSAFKTQD